MAVFVVPDPVNRCVAPSVPQAPASSSILTRLRVETRGEHDAVERVLDLMGAALTREAYRLRLEQFYGFYGPLEAALQSRCDRKPAYAGESNLSGATCSALESRLTKTALLRQDLHHLGVSTDDLPLCRHLPSVLSEAEVLGCLYVMEGATLGGQLITRHIQATLGITPTTGGGFFEGYAGDTGKMWRAMRHLLVSCALDTRTENAMVASAIATFACLRGWCDPRNSNADNDNQNQTQQTEIERDANELA